MTKFAEHRIGIVIANYQVPSREEALVISGVHVKGMIRHACRQLPEENGAVWSSEILDMFRAQEEILFGGVHKDVSSRGALTFSSWEAQQQPSEHYKKLLRAKLNHSVGGVSGFFPFEDFVRPFPDDVSVAFEGKVHHGSDDLFTGRVHDALARMLPLVSINGRGLIKSVIIETDGYLGIRAEDGKNTKSNSVFEVIKWQTKNLLEVIAYEPELLGSLEWRDVERILAEAFEELGFSVELTRGGKDGGKDIVLEYNIDGGYRGACLCRGKTLDAFREESRKLLCGQTY